MYVMNKKIGKIAFPIFFVFWAFTVSKGQKHEIGLGVGVLNYSGDLTTIPNVLMSRPAINAFYRFNASPAVSLRGGLLFGKIAGKESPSSANAVGKVRQGEFEASLSQLALAFEYNFFNYEYRAKKGDRRITPYFTAGLSLYNFEHDKVVTNEPLNSRYAFQFAIPFGLGLKYRIKSRLNFNAEFIANKTFNDYLDGVSNSPASNATAGSSPKYLSNPLTSDWFYYFGVSLSYTFYKIYCPD
jgi:hypothetical protein